MTKELGLLLFLQDPKENRAFVVPRESKGKPWSFCYTTTEKNIVHFLSLYMTNENRSLVVPAESKRKKVALLSL